MSPNGTFSWRWYEIFFQVLMGFQMKIWGEKKKNQKSPKLSLYKWKSHWWGLFSREQLLRALSNCMFICKTLASMACFTHLQAYLSSFSPAVRNLVLLLKSHLITVQFQYACTALSELTWTTMRNRFINHNVKFISSSFCL